VIGWKDRPGDNLFTASLVALDPDTGKMKWYFQTSPHDTHDEGFHAGSRAFRTQGASAMSRRALRSGGFFVLDRTNGKAVVSSSIIKSVKNFSGFDSKGVAIPKSRSFPQPDGSIRNEQCDQSGILRVTVPSQVVLCERGSQSRDLLRL